MPMRQLNMLSDFNRLSIRKRIGVLEGYVRTYCHFLGKGLFNSLIFSTFVPTQTKL